MGLLSGTPVAPDAGRDWTTDGLDDKGCDIVVKLPWNGFARWFPKRSVTAVETTAVIVAPYGREMPVSDTVRSSVLALIYGFRLTDPLNREKFWLLIVDGSIDSENVKVTTAFGPTPVDPGAGVMETVGAVVLVPLPVVNVAL